MVNIYVLELENKKYYVGKTKNLDFRINQHFSEHGSEWTKKHRPVKILTIINNCDDWDENKWTLIIMSKYGIENVRGGSWSQIDLSEDEVKNISNMISGCQDKCFGCGENTHFVKECKNRRKKKTCSRCGRNSHTKPKCWAKTHLNGTVLSDGYKPRKRF